MRVLHPRAMPARTAPKTVARSASSQSSKKASVSPKGGKPSKLAKAAKKAAKKVAQVAKKALEICHFDPATGEDRRRSSVLAEECEAACYDCLMHYANQPVHRILDRQTIKEVLLRMSRARAEAAPGVGRHRAGDRRGLSGGRAHGR